MIEFKRIQPKDREIYQRYFLDGEERGAELSFVNLNLWGEQSYAIVEDQFVLFSCFHDKYVYTFPVGNGDKRAALDLLIADAKERGIPFVLTGIYEKEKAVVESLYPNRFEFHSPESFYDYVYAIDDLADLAGKKYHRKRNHCRRFSSAHSYLVRPISSEDFPRLSVFVKEWYESRAEDGANFDMEILAIERVLESYDDLGMYGLILEVEGQIVAFTMGNRFSLNTIDVNFEKAKDVDGAYAVINQSFAQFIRSNIPEIRFFNREEDMGIEGLRRAKENYFPHHKVVKYRAQEKNREV